MEAVPLVEDCGEKIPHSNISDIFKASQGLKLNLEFKVHSGPIAFSAGTESLGITAPFQGVKWTP